MRLSNTAKKYVRFMISNKEVKNRGYRNQSASNFYRYLRLDANRYNCTVFDVLERQAAFVIDGVVKLP